MAEFNEKDFKIVSRYVDEFYKPPFTVVPPLAVPDGYTDTKEPDIMELPPGDGMYFSVPPEKIEKPKFEAVYKRVIKYQSIIRKYAQKYGVDENIVMAVMSRESSGNQNAEAVVTSRQKKYPYHRAYGLMQLIPATAVWNKEGWDFKTPPSENYSDHFRLLPNQNKVSQANKSKPLFDLKPGETNIFYQDIKIPENNIQAGVKYLRYLIRLLKRKADEAKVDNKVDIAKIFSGYNAGPAYVIDAQKKFKKNPREWFDRLDESRYAGHPPDVNENKPYITHNVALYLKYASKRKGTA